SSKLQVVMQKPGSGTQIITQRWGGLPYAVQAIWPPLLSHAAGIATGSYPLRRHSLRERRHFPLKGGRGRFCACVLNRRQPFRPLLGGDGVAKQPQRGWQARTNAAAG